MQTVAWYKLTSKQKKYLRSTKPLTLIMGSGYVQPEKLQVIVEQHLSTDVVLAGQLLDDWLPELDHVPQFKPASKNLLESSLQQWRNEKKLMILRYNFAHSHYLIRELQPTTVIWFNGSWARTLHQHDMYWEAFNAEADIEILSPFVDATTAKNYGIKLDNQNTRHLHNTWFHHEPLQLRDDEVMSLAQDVSKLSWDWEGQTGAVLVDTSGKVLAWGDNTVLPYPAAMLHNGSLRQQRLSPPGQDQQWGQTIHAEQQAVTQALRQGIDIRGTRLFVTKMPCPYCAMFLSRLLLDEIVYHQEYPNPLSQQILVNSNFRPL